MVGVMDEDDEGFHSVSSFSLEMGAMRHGG